MTSESASTKQEPQLANIPGEAVPGATRLISDLILDQARDGICLQDKKGRIEWVNPACEEMFGWALDEVRGRFSQEFILPDECRPTTEEIENFQYDRNSPLFGKHLISENIRRDGSRFWNQQTFSAIQLGPDEDHIKIIITCRDVTDQVNTNKALKQVQVNLKHAANHDDLTGLANRNKLSEALESERVTHLISTGRIGVLQVDIDKFKEINDTLGHAAGDATLRHVASALRSCTGLGDLVCRTGGDEFLLVFMGRITRKELQMRANAVIKAVGEPLSFQGHPIRIGCSIGVSMPVSGDSSGEILIQQADQALYSAKNQGRGMAVFFTPKLGEYHKEQQRLVQDLILALEEKQFEVYLQPQFDLVKNQVTGCEALIRWDRPGHGIQPPIAFLDVAEKAGLLAEIDYESMNLALDALKTLREGGFGDMHMSINVSASILADVNYPGLLDWAMQSRDIDPRNICIEILETAILDGGDLDVRAAVERLKHLGVKVSLDDFGTGYAGLAHMATFEIDAIKLDRSMITRLDDDPRNRVIVRSIIWLCRKLGVNIVAEGVETQCQLDLLRRAHCPIIQGYGLARPMPLTDLLGWLETHKAPVDPLEFEPLETAKPIALPSRSAG
ncbi:diguanylate cyclase/phosphodiesterase (GGDEF & EAL domains) with PAS/PAC sensor(s) [hydrothermal vent metagenome]|uniref:Diguanylate cyclase/phosphodiesterase (GGDEF & EAL domains) with PAS/PAC sensor(S) n=1 Tax=hydrothermal vent metagenome TaxID=652676 RepID=A0A3B0RC90_9ZZZZ